MVVAEQNDVRDPFRFCLQSPLSKAFFEFANEDVARTAPPLYLTGVTDANDIPMRMNWQSPEGEAILRQNFEGEFARLFPGQKLTKEGKAAAGR